MPLKLLILVTWLQTISSVEHERSLIWAQKDAGVEGLARLVAVSGDPHVWVTDRSATTTYITAPNSKWRFTALAFDYVRHFVYWSDSGNHKIQRIELGVKNHFAEDVVSGISGQVNGLAVDWLSGNIYWCDGQYSWVAMATLTGNHGDMFRTVVSEGLDVPAGLAVSPHLNMLVWSDVGVVPRIETASLAGGGRRVLVDAALTRPVAVVLEEPGGGPGEGAGARVYWVDAGQGTVSSVSVQGGDRQTHFSMEHAGFSGLALSEDYLFLTAQAEKQLVVYNRRLHKHEVNFNLTPAVPYGIIMYDQQQGTPLDDSCEKAGCRHLCIHTADQGATCLCSDGYFLLEDGRSCVEDPRYKRPQFLYSIGGAICRFPANLPHMSMRNVSLDTQCFLTNRHGVVAMATNTHQRVLYFSENQSKTISRVYLAEGASPDVVVGGTGSVEGLAVDWLANNLYWTDSELAHIGVCKADGRYQRVLVDTGLTRPQGLAVDPVARWLYWSDLASPATIAKSRLDGSDREILVQQGLMAPKQLVIDYKTNRLYWSDSELGQVAWIPLDGDTLTVAVSLPETTIYGIAVFREFVVWTAQGDYNGIHAGLKDTGEKLRGVLHPGIGQAYDVVAYDVDTQPLVDSPCDGKSPCSQLCFPGSDAFSTVCKCGLGLALGADRKSCVAVETSSDNFLLFTDTYHKQLYQMDTETGKFSGIPLSDHDNPIAVDFDPIDRKIFWTDVGAKVIKMAGLDGAGEKVVKTLPYNSTPDGIAIDVQSRLLYYTDTGRKLIAAITLDGLYHLTLISKDIGQPRAIALDPAAGSMYWSDWSVRSRIEKANMDGTERRVLVDTGLGHWPNGLTIDTTGQKLYWCDARSDTIHTSDLEGENVKVIFQSPDTHFFGITNIGDTLYYTDWTKRAIQKLEVTSTGGYQATSFGPALFARTNDIHAYKFAVNTQTMNACSYHQGGCSQFCLPLPSGKRCACTDGYFLQTDGTSCAHTQDLHTSGESSKANQRQEDLTKGSHLGTTPVSSTSERTTDLTSLSSLHASTSPTITNFTQYTTNLPITNSVNTPTVSTATSTITTDTSSMMNPSSINTTTLLSSTVADWVDKYRSQNKGKSGKETDLDVRYPEDRSETNISDHSMSSKKAKGSIQTTIPTLFGNRKGNSKTPVYNGVTLTSYKPTIPSSETDTKNGGTRRRIPQSRNKYPTTPVLTKAATTSTSIGQAQSKDSVQYSTPTWEQLSTQAANTSLKLLPGGEGALPLVALCSILAAGAFLMVLIVVIAAVIYRRCSRGGRLKRQAMHRSSETSITQNTSLSSSPDHQHHQAFYGRHIASFQDTYEMPVKDMARQHHSGDATMEGDVECRYIGTAENISEFDSDFDDDDMTDVGNHDFNGSGLSNNGYVNSCHHHSDQTKVKVKAAPSAYECGRGENLPTFLTFLQAHSQAVDHTDMAAVT